MSGFTNYTFPFSKLKRKLQSEKNLNYDFIGDNYFVFESSDKLAWKITSQTKKNDKWKLQKATTNFGGRNWEAWFTTDIPYSEGPFKFNGLPGLIVELKDSNNNFSYTLIRIEKPEYANKNIVETVFKKKPILISYQKFKDLLIANYNDPYSRFRSMKPGTWSIGRADDTYVDTLEGLNKLTKEEQENIRRNYNPIELDKSIKFVK